MSTATRSEILHYFKSGKTHAETLIAAQTDGPSILWLEGRISEEQELIGELTEMAACDPGISKYRNRLAEARGALKAYQAVTGVPR